MTQSADDEDDDFKSGLSPDETGRICQVCSAPRPDSPFDESWSLYRYTFEQGQLLSVLICTWCSRLSLEAVLAGYKARIRSGADVRYH